MRDELLPSDLLLVLNALVITDGGPSGLRGHLSVGVQGRRGTYWWAARMGEKIVTSFPERAPAGADAIFLLGELEALAVMTGDPFPERPRLEIQGDWSLMEQFLGRYICARKRREARSGVSHSGLSQRFRRSESSARFREIRGTG